MTLAAVLLGLLATGCGNSGASGGTATPGAPDTAALDTSEGCSLLASTVQAELARWASSDIIVNAPIAETRLGPQPSDGVPGVLVDGCVWEARGPNGGHIGVAVERFTSVDLDQLTAMAADNSIEPDRLSDGRWRWTIPPSGESPSGAVVVGDSSDLVVVRVESFSDDPARTFIADTRDGAEHFFDAIGDELEAPDPR